MAGPALFTLGDTIINLAGTSTSMGGMTSIGTSIITATDTLSLNAGTSIFFDTSDSMMVSADGNVGIGTSSPILKTHIHGTHGAPTTSGTPTGGILRLSQTAGTLVMDMGTLTDGSGLFNGGWIQSYNHEASTHLDLYLNPNGGNVGINKNNPGYPLDIHGNAGANVSTGYYWSGAAIAPNSGITNVKLKVTGSITATDAFVASSDSRIKKDIVDIPDDEALADLRLLKPCKYKYIDDIGRGMSTAVYGFIAQEVKEVLPYAVKITPSEEYIPNVYQSGTYNNNTITLPGPHGLTKNGSVQLIITIEAKNIYCPFTIVNDTTLNIDTSYLSGNDIPSNDPLYDKDGNPYPYNIFVYGTPVDDFHTLNKAAIWTTGVAALQEIDRIQQSNNIKIQDLITQLDAEKIKVNNLESELAAIKTHLGL